MTEQEQEQILNDLWKDAVSKESATEDGWPKGSPEAEVYWAAAKKFNDFYNSVPKDVSLKFYLTVILA